MRLSLPILIFALTLPPILAQTPAARYRIAGTVVSAIDHHPLQRASIQILNPENQEPIQSTTSDEYGHFAFTGVPAGNFELQGTAPNYLATFYDDHDGFNTGIITAAGVDTESLILQLLPQGTIAGVIRDESTEPVPDAHITLLRQTHDFGDSRTVNAGDLNTDDFGRFEFAHLRPGTYFLAVTAAPWYAVHPDLTQPNSDAVMTEQYSLAVQRQHGVPTFSFADSIDPSLDVAYAATFYPGTTDPASASPILIRGGDSKDVALQLTPQPTLSLILPHPTPKRGQSENSPQLRISFRGQVLYVMGEFRQTPDHVVITGLAPGDYFLSDGRVSSSSIEGDTPIHLADRSITVDAHSAQGQAHVHVVLHSAPDTKLSSSTQVVLVRSNHEASASTLVDEKNQATLDANPGDYSFAVIGDHGSLSVGQVLSGDRPLPSNSFHLASDETAFFTLTVIPRNHTLKGVARKDGKPCPGAFILLVPTNQVHNVHDFYLQQSDLDGSWDIRGLAPGDYTLLAIDNGWDLDWQREAILSHYLPAAATIHIPDTADKIQTLTRPLTAQPR